MEKSNYRKDDRAASADEQSTEKTERTPVITSSSPSNFRSDPDRPREPSDGDRETESPAGTDDDVSHERRDRPAVSVKKHRGQYSVVMNPMPYRDGDGKLTWPADVEPVRIRLQGKRQDGRGAGVVSPESSVSVELRAPCGRERRAADNATQWP